MDTQEDWTIALRDNPIFSQSKSLSEPTGEAESSLELSTNTLSSFTNVHPTHDGSTPFGRRQVMTLKEADLIVAAGKEIRMTSLGDAQLGQSTRKTYKTLHTPNVQFEIHQIALNPSGKLLAVAGTFQVAVIVLPRAGYIRLVPNTLDCKSVQIGQFYHASKTSAPIAKIDWHPWGEAGSTLLVMTVDGKLREYDISVDTEEPLQVLSFVSAKKVNSFKAEDESEREVVSFTLGKGNADWGPLTVYAVMRSGDIYSICPYMPQNASISSSYVHSLECFISAKQEFLSQGTSSVLKNLTTLYDYQRKYVTALIKQLPPGTVFPAASRSVLMHPPVTIKSLPARQGPFLLQPSPKVLEGSEGGEATDIIYVNFATDKDETEYDGSQTEHLGVMMIAYQDGKVDVFLDVEKVEARWDVKQASNTDLPMLAVYETIDLGLVSMLNGLNDSSQDTLLNLLHGNHPVLLLDPIHDDTLYVYHAFGVHALHIGPVLQSLAIALRTDADEGDDLLTAKLQDTAGTLVQPLLTTFSVERKCSNLVVGVTIPNDVYLTYGIFILTSAMRITAFPLNLRTYSSRTGDEPLPEDKEADDEPENWLKAIDGPPTYISLLGPEIYKPPSILSRFSGVQSMPRLSLPKTSVSQEFMLTPDTLRYIGSTVGVISGQIHEIQLAYRATAARTVLQRQEMVRQTSKSAELATKIDKLKGSRRKESEARFEKIHEVQRNLLKRLDMMLRVLMEQASPELSEHETKWFEELKRMKEDIVGAGKYDDESLLARTQSLEREYDRIQPNLKKLAEHEVQNKLQAQCGDVLGFTQAFELGERSNAERTRIAKIETEISRLADQLNLTLNDPPAQQ